MLLHISPGALLRPAVNSFTKCRFQRLLIIICLLMIAWTQSSHRPHLQLEIAHRLMPVQRFQNACKFSWEPAEVKVHSCSKSGICRMCLTARPSLPPPGPNEAEPTPKCHWHAIRVTIYVKLKRNSKIELTWWNMLHASTINLLAEFSSRNRSGSTVSCWKPVGQEIT